MLKGLIVVFVVMGLIAGATSVSGRIFVHLDKKEKERKKAEKAKKKAEKESAKKSKENDKKSTPKGDDEKQPQKGEK